MCQNPLSYDSHIAITNTSNLNIKGPGREWDTAAVPSRDDTKSTVCASTSACNQWGGCRTRLQGCGLLRTADRGC